MDLTNYILPELLILVPVLYAVGYALKRNGKIADESIPLILCATGIILVFLYIMSTTPLNNSQAWGNSIFASITQGILCGSAAIGINQVVKQGEKAGQLNTLVQTVETIVSSESEDETIPEKDTTIESKEEDTKSMTE